jgi:hypothetical protein
MHWVTAIEYLSGYKLRVQFEDSSVRIVDLTSHLDGEIFKPLRDLRLFKTAHLNPDLDTVVWANGSDMSPDFLYEIGTPVKQSVRKLPQIAETRAKYGKR